jgi:colanic acid/amylovoran biosynthesis glycosyltransferase
MAANLEMIGCPIKKLTVHPLGVDVEGLPSVPRRLKAGEPLGILFAGTFREKKGISYVIEAAALIQRAGMRFKLHLVGDNAGKPGDRETKETILRQIRSLDLQDVVVHHSFLTFQDLIGLALRLHVFVAPSVTAGDGDAEGTPFVLQQMMATGMPVVSTRHSDIPYLFGEHQHLLVPERDAQAIAKRLEEYVNEPHTLLEHGMRLRERMFKAFEVRTCAAALSDLYDEVQ